VTQLADERDLMHDRPRPPATFRTVTFAELRDVHHEPPPRAALGVAKVGVTVNAGSPKVGKTTFQLQMAVAVAAPGVSTFLGAPVCTGPVLLVIEEGSLDGLAWRLRKQSEAVGVDDLPIELAHRQRLRLDDRGAVRWLRDHVRSLRPALVVMDPLNRLHGQDENKPSAMTPIMDALADVSSEASCAVVAIHHLSKPGMDRSGSVWDRFRGASSIRSATDGNLALDAVRGGIRLRGEFRDAEPLDVWMTFDRERLLFAVAEAPEAPSKVSSADLLTLATERGQITARDVMRRFGVSKHTALSALGAADLDRIEGPRGVGVYFIGAGGA
jgi:hypothetical protein